MRAAAAAIRARQQEILAANALDMADGQTRQACRPPCSTAWRSTTSGSRRWPRASKTSLRCPIPSDANWRAGRVPNGLDIARVATPIGVIGMIYESRPNVTADAGALALKSGNVAILRGGSEFGALFGGDPRRDGRRRSRPRACRKPRSVSCQRPTAPRSA